MSPNPSKVMAPVQMQSSPIQTHTKDQLIVIAKGNRLGREKADRAKGKIKVRDKEYVQPSITCNKAGYGRLSPKRKSPQNVCKPNIAISPSGTKVKGKCGSSSPPLKQEQGHYNGRSSISPDGSSYAGAKFSEAPTPDLLPMPPAHWLSSFSSGKKVKSCPQQQQACGPLPFDMIAKDLKMMLKVES